MIRTDGCKFELEPIKATLPPGEEITLRLNGIPREHGALIIKGVKVVAFGGLVQEFAVVGEHGADGQKIIDAQRKRFEINQRAISKKLYVIRFLIIPYT